ncbi:hypothetical protein O181_076220 [Austropuccinia psidii MF-1]|uniref:Uncharacterized protein n=1 Tax=Austropuccinia psidii MF-1 TaxID=1389203 RepID=A0A9Q3F882_9BASI|nr:hypothetical protein [Austropuccinia psidii MF-1]
MIREIANSPPDSDTQGSDELDGEEVEVDINPVLPLVILLQKEFKVTSFPPLPELSNQPLFKDNGDKTPHLTRQYFQSRQEWPKTSSWQNHKEIYVHILIGHQFLGRRALWNSFWDTTQGSFIEKRILIEIKENHILKFQKDLLNEKRRGKII